MTERKKKKELRYIWRVRSKKVQEEKGCVESAFEPKDGKKR